MEQREQSQTAFRLSYAESRQRKTIVNTTMNQAELEAAGKLIMQAAVRQLKDGKAVSLGPLGKIRPAVSGRWVEKAVTTRAVTMAVATTTTTLRGSWRSKTTDFTDFF